MTISVGAGEYPLMVTSPRRHLYARGRTQCGNRWYKTGFSPCELALPEGMTAAVLEQPRDKRKRRTSDADIQAAADILGLSACKYRTDDERAADALVLNVSPRDDAYLAKYVYDLMEKQLRNSLPTTLASIAEEMRKGTAQNAAMLAVAPKPGTVTFHEYRKRLPIHSHEIMLVPVEETLCLGTWYTTGTAPCEKMDADDDAALNIPACEADLEAARELLNLPPRATVCRAKGRASWADK